MYPKVVIIKDCSKNLFYIDTTFNAYHTLELIQNFFNYNFQRKDFEIIVVYETEQGIDYIKEFLRKINEYTEIVYKEFCEWKTIKIEEFIKTLIFNEINFLTSIKSNLLI